MTVENAEIRLIDGTDYDAPPSNPNTAGLIPGAGSDDTKPPYTIDMSAALEANDGSNRSLGTALAEIDANTAKTTDLSADGSKYTGDISAATFNNGDLTPDDLLRQISQQTTIFDDGITANKNKLADMSADGSSYSGAVTGDASGAKGVAKTTTTAIADLTAAPTQADFNGLLAVLRSSGVLKAS